MSKENTDFNPHPQYSFNSGLCYEDGEPVFGEDVDWLYWELEHGRIHSMKTKTFIL